MRACDSTQGKAAAEETQCRGRLGGGEAGAEEGGAREGVDETEVRNVLKGAKQKTGSRLFFKIL